MPRRIKHNAFVLSLWACVWLLGTYPLGRPLSEASVSLPCCQPPTGLGYCRQSSSWRGLALHVHRVLLRPHRLLRGLDVHHQLHVPWLGSSRGVPVGRLLVDSVLVLDPWSAQHRSLALHSPSDESPGPRPSKRRHSLPWNEFLAQDPGRTWPVLHNVMAMVLPDRLKRTHGKEFD